MKKHLTVGILGLAMLIGGTGCATHRTVIVHHGPGYVRHCTTIVTRHVSHTSCL